MARRIALAIAIALTLTSAATLTHSAEVKPVTNTTKAPYNESKAYCNGGSGGASLPINVVCYNHDSCYSDPSFNRTKKPPASRSWCDSTFLKQCNRVASVLKCYPMYGVIKASGWTSWNRSRENDKNQKD